MSSGVDDDADGDGDGDHVATRGSTRGHSLENNFAAIWNYAATFAGTLCERAC